MARLPIADRWFERKRIADDVTLLWEPHVHPLLRCNIWHVRGRDRDLLIDTGVGLKSLKAEIQDLIDKPLTTVATHIHYDHVGSLHEFDERLMHPLEASLMERYEEQFADLKASAFPEDFQSALGLGSDGYLITALPFADYDPDGYDVTATTVTRSIDEGDIVDLGDRHFEVMHLPGHSPGSIGLWEEDTGTFFSGDAVYDGVLLDELPESNVQAYVRTMKRLRELPVTIVHGGHEPSFGRGRLREIVDDYLALRDG